MLPYILFFVTIGKAQSYEFMEKRPHFSFVYPASVKKLDSTVKKLDTHAASSFSYIVVK
jgi:hypothetical protein